VKKDVDCLVFEDQLDALVAGGLPVEGLEQLQLHAFSCPDCAMLLKVKEHLTRPSLEELEAAVPQNLLDSMWPRVEKGLGGSPGPARARPSPGTRLPWLVPSLAAASVVLLLSTGFLFSALRRTTARGDELARQVSELQLGMEELDARTEWVERTAQLAGNSRNRARALNFQLAGQESITVGALVELLETYPPERVLLDASQVRSLFGSTQRTPPGLREVLVLLDDILSPRLEGREIRAGDLAEWLNSAELPRDLSLPKASLIELLS
jgi:hypothetical protein